MPLRRLPTSLLPALLTGVMLTTLVGPAEAANHVTRPPAGQIAVEGRGYGHGRGMSQWGAYGAANAGKTWRQITEFYYPGTSRQVLKNSPIRVLISGDEGSDVRVDPAPGLSVSSKDGKVLLPIGTRFESWRLIRRTSGLVLQRQNNGMWYDHPVSLGIEPAFTTSSGLVRLIRPDGTRQELRGSVHAVVHSTSPSVRTVAVLSMENYLRSVVPAEMPASWHSEALKAQSVAARSYAARLRAGAKDKAWDTCDTVSCQVFAGTALYRADGSLIKRGEHARTDAAIAATAGTVLTYGSSPALTEFSAANGGYSAKGSVSTPYLITKKDPYDGRIASNAHVWTVAVPVSKVEAAFPTVGSLRRIGVDSRSGHGEWGGRVLHVTVLGSRGSKTVTGDSLRAALGLKSNWFSFGAGETFPKDWNTDGAADVLAIDSSNRLWLYGGRGDGGFVARKQVGTGWGIRDRVIQVGDWDGDGAADVLARDPATRSLLLYRGRGDGSFAGVRKVGTGWHVMDALIGPGDWDGDGRPDVLARRSKDGSLWLYPGNGVGGFGKARQVGRGWSPFDLLTAVGDLDGDGNPDLVARRGGYLWLYPGSGNGGFRSPRVVGAGWQVMDSLYGPGDWDGDGTVDLLARRRDGSLQLYAGLGNGRLGRATPVGSGWSNFRVVP